MTLNTGHAVSMINADQYRSMPDQNSVMAMKQLHCKQEMSDKTHIYTDGQTICKSLSDKFHRTFARQETFENFRD